jgi:ribulose-phosphate 3-epimerase
MKAEICPGILTHNIEEYTARLEGVEQSGASWAHLDVMDGHFVPNITVQPYEIMGIPTNLNLEAHLMAYRPERYYSDLTVARISRVLIHREAFDSFEETAEALHQASDYFSEVGLVLNPETPIEPLKDLKIQVVQIMGVHPGSSGQQTLGSTYDRIKEIADQKLKVTISVDGGVSEENIRELQQAGATRFVITSHLGAISAMGQNLNNFTQLLLGTS